MINWILHNKEWLFSGAGISFLALLYIFIRHIYKKSKHTIEQTAQTEKILTKEQEQKNSNTDIFANNDFTHPDVLDIKKDFDSTPPFQKNEKLKYYKGLKVKWLAYLRIVHKEQDGITTVTLSVEGNFLLLINCDIKIDEFPELKIAMEMTKIIVTGEIYSTDGYTTILDKARLKIIK